MTELTLNLDLDRWQGVATGGSFEEASAALETVVAQLEAGQLTLDQAVACYEIGVRLAERCERLLDDAELRVRRIEELVERVTEDARWPLDGDEVEPR